MRGLYAKTGIQFRGLCVIIRIATKIAVGFRGYMKITGVILRNTGSVRGADLKNILTRPRRFRQRRGGDGSRCAARARLAMSSRARTPRHEKLSLHSPPLPLESPLTPSRQGLRGQQPRHHRLDAQAAAGDQNEGRGQEIWRPPGDRFAAGVAVSVFKLGED